MQIEIEEVVSISSSGTWWAFSEGIYEYETVCCFALVKAHDIASGKLISAVVPLTEREMATDLIGLQIDLDHRKVIDIGITAN